ncbi:nitrate reductase molybdenum cofactor assembly chaperone [Streptomyces sp. NPDC004542]|uniref:nitrate reductase molybdenum cofactor assembly chaperone n=1 Tax=Streptomyces sp. NPDC004542 TaxID=3154281 RepID=UPI0033BCB44B
MISRRRARRPAADTPLVHRIASLLLRYPDETMLACLDDIAAALPAVADPADRARLATTRDHLLHLPPTEAAQRYVGTFDHTRHRSLHLTYYRHGDTRARGMALLALKHTYRRAGHEPPEAELPDFLQLMLEFAALVPEPGHRILLQCQAGLEFLRQALHEYSTPYADVLDTLCGRLPEPARRERDAWRRPAAEGPPGEQVGLEPFGPPEQTGLEPFALPGHPAPPAYPTQRAFLSAEEGR